MSYVTHRPSILHRPKRETKVNEESLEAQYEREQAYWQHKAEKSQETHNRLMRSIYSTQEDKRQMYEDLQRIDQQRRAAQEAERLRMSVREDAYQRTDDALRNSLRSSQDFKPWSAHVHTAGLSKEEEDAARRRFAAEVAAENARLMAEKQLQRQRESQMDRLATQQALNNEQSWFNYGAAHTQWLQQGPGSRPQMASHPAHDVRPTSAQVPWGTEMNANVHAVQGQAPPPKQYPWSWQQQ